MSKSGRERAAESGRAQPAREQEPATEAQHPLGRAPAGGAVQLSRLAAESPAQAARAARAMQRRQGNAVVARAANQAYAERYRFYVATLPVPPQGIIHEFPVAYGVSGPGHPNTYTFPEPLVVKEADKYRFARAKAADSEQHTSWIVKAGRYPIGDFKSNGAGHDAAPAIKNIVTTGQSKTPVAATPTQNPGTYKIYVNISDAKQAEIHSYEHEHIQDWEYAYTISLKRVADTINELSSQAFIDPGTAWATLVYRLPLELIPSDPWLPAHWQRRLTDVIEHLCNLSIDRDKNQQHATTAFTTTIDDRQREIDVTPEFSGIHKPSSEVILFTKLGRNFSIQRWNSLQDLAERIQDKIAPPELDPEIAALLAPNLPPRENKS